MSPANAGSAREPSERRGATVFDHAVVVAILILSSGELNEHLRIGGETARGANQALILPLYLLLALLALLRPTSIGRTLKSAPTLVLLVLVASSSLLWTINVPVTGARVIVLTASVLSVAHIARQFDIGELARAVAVASVILAIVNLLYVGAFPGTGIMQEGHEGAWRGIYTQKNGLARTMALGTVACGWVGVTAAGSRGLRMLGVGGTFLCGGLMLLTTSMTAVVAISAAAIAVLVARVVRGRGVLVVLGAISVALLVLLLAVLLAAYADDAVATLGRDLTFTGRTLVWGAAFAEYLSKPLLGFGYGAFWTGWSGPAATVWSQVGWEPGDSHNGLLDVALDLGFIGFALLIAHLSAVLAAALSWSRSGTRAAAWPLMFFVLFLAYNMTENAMLRPTNLYWVLHMIIALQVAVAASQRSVEQRRSVGSASGR